MVNSRPSKASYRLKPGDRVRVTIPPPSPRRLRPEPVPFGVIHEDDALIVVNKPAGLVVHPAPGHPTGTLVHGLLERCSDLSGIGGVTRPGVVHRLDKDTSGLMVVAKGDHTHTSLAEQFKSGSIKKQYLTIVHGCVHEAEGRIDLSIARHPKHRKRMAVTREGGRRAVTLWKRERAFQIGFSFLSVSLKTGRTHQIRVHLSHLGHPVLGDPVYGFGRNWWKRQPLHAKGLLPTVDRQMLHAARLGFNHPLLNEYMEFEAPLPDDMNRILEAMEQLDR
jgi:23S rRNA pseudouridine1911/1915/1917 synthase